MLTQRQWVNRKLGYTTDEGDGATQVRSINFELHKSRGRGMALSLN